MGFFNKEIKAFGLVTREDKGSELTYSEMDNNIRLALEALIFSGFSLDGVGELPAIKSPVAAVDDGSTMHLTPINGYICIDLEGTNHTGDIIQVVSGAVDGVWWYSADLMSGSFLKSIYPNTKYIVLKASSDVDIYFAAGSVGEG